MMGHNNSREREVPVDIESGGNGFPGDANSDPIAGNKQGNRLLNKLTSWVLRYGILASGGWISHVDDNLGNANQDLQENVKLLIDKNPGSRGQKQIPPLGKERAKEKPQSINSIKASKPPRPPKAPLIDAYDLKLVKEISELLQEKRARKERVRALKRARAAKLSSSPSSSTNSTICCMAVTIVFFLIIILQGFSWTNSSILQSSPEPTAIGSSTLISAQVFNNHLPSYDVAPTSVSPSSVEQFFGSGFTSPD